MPWTLGVRLLVCAALLVIVATGIAVLPAIFIPLGLPPEGDAIDYRIPLIRWILRHHTFPNWPWTPIDDYPALGELLIVPFYWLSPGFGRIVPILAYFACAWAGGLILRDSFDWSGFQWAPKTQRFLVPLVGAAWILPFRPLAIQGNLFMLDNLATAFALFGLWYVVRGKGAGAGIFWGLALATKYMIWAASPAILAAWFITQGWSARSRRGATLLVLLATAGAMPTMLRNAWLNQNPVFPMFLGLFGQLDVGLNYNLELYGRGRDFLSLLLLPWDLLITHSFQRDLFDYTLGKLFYLQALVTISVLVWSRGRQVPAQKINSLEGSNQYKRYAWALLAFSVLHTLAWFYTSQQMRFLVASWIIVELALLRLLWQRAAGFVIAPLLLLGLLSIASIQKDMWLMLGGKPMIFQADLDRARQCLGDLSHRQGIVIGHNNRDSVLGFFDYDFVYMKPHVYRVDPPGEVPPEPDFIYSTQRVTYPGYEAPEGENSCLWRRSASAKAQ